MSLIGEFEDFSTKHMDITRYRDPNWEYHENEKVRKPFKILLKMWDFGSLIGQEIFDARTCDRTCRLKPKIENIKKCQKMRFC